MLSSSSDTIGKIHTLILATIVVISVFISGGQTAFAELLPVTTELTLTEWYVLGPFHTGTRESGVDPLWFNGRYQLDFPPDFTKTYPSIYARGGQAYWTQFKTGENGQLDIALPNPPPQDWLDWTDEYGRCGASWRGYAYAQIKVTEDCRALVDAQNIGGFRINGRSYSGDPYGNSIWIQPVKLDKGVNHILVGCSGFEGQGSFVFRILSAPDVPAAVITNDLMYPDIREYQPLDSWVGVPIVNYTDEWLNDLSVDFGYPEGLSSPPCIVPSIPPFGMLKIPVPIKTTNETLGIRTEENELSAWVRVSGEGWENKTEFKFRVRRAKQTWRETFLSDIDGSVQKYAVRPPVPLDPNRDYALIMSTHGAGVDCDGQVEAYGPKDWAYVVAPTNRRPFGFDWQDWGRLDFLEVLGQAKKKFNIDENRVILTGHSMGGHGAWIIGTTHSDTFAAVCPIASWASHELYVSYTLRQSELFGSPEVKLILNRCVASDKTELLISNLCGTPVLAVHGTMDRVVAPTHPRLLIGELQKYGSDARLIEVPEAEHWWDFDTEREGSDAVDTKELEEWMHDKVLDDDPDSFSFVTYDLANENSKHYITILAQDKLYEETRVQARLTQGVMQQSTSNEQVTTDHYSVSISTKNVKALKFSPPERFVGFDFRADIDGDLVRFKCNKEGHNLYRGHDGRWTDKSPIDGLGKKFTGVSGPIKRAYYEPFIVVDMSNGSEPKCAEFATNIAVRWWYRSNGYCRVMKWNELTEEDKQNYNLIIITTQKSLDSQLAEYLPFKFVEEVALELTNERIVDTIKRGAPLMAFSQPGIEFGDRYIWGRNLSVQFVYPSLYNENKLMHVNMAQTEDALDTCAALTPLYSGSSLPDFVLASREGIARWGMQGAIAIGFFDANWQFDVSSMYLTEGIQSTDQQY